MGRLFPGEYEISLQNNKPWMDLKYKTYFYFYSSVGGGNFLFQKNQFNEGAVVQCSRGNILSLPGFSFRFKNFYIYTEKYIVGDVQ